MVSPVTHYNMTQVSAYLPDDIFYDFYTHVPVRGHGERMVLNAGYTHIPTHIKGGSIVPMRVNGANTTTELRKQNFTVVVAPGLDGTATGSLYLDDGDSLVQSATSNIDFKYSSDGQFSMDGTFDYDPGVSIQSIVLLGAKDKPSVSGANVLYNSVAGTVTYEMDVSLQKSLNVSLLGS